MALALLLAMIVGASVESVTSASIVAGSVGTVLGGFVSNRADASLWWGCQALLKTVKPQDAGPMRTVLGRSLWLSYLQALKSVCSECKAELVGQYELKYRGQPNYPPEVRADIQWLDSKLHQLSQEMRAIDKGDLSTVPDIAWKNLESFVTPTDGQSETGLPLKQAAASRLVSATYEPDMLPLYKDKLGQLETGLFERICGFFAQQLAQDSALQIFFENTLLMQISSGMAEQSITLQQVLQQLNELSQVVPQQLNQALEKLESVEVGQTETNDRTVLILEEVLEVKAQIETLKLPYARELSLAKSSNVGLEEVRDRQRIEPNPFNLLSGRIDDPKQLFGQESILDGIFSLLNSGSSVAMIGDKQTGKSSLLKAIQAESKERLSIARSPIYIDLQLAPNEADFYDALCHHAEIQEKKGFERIRALKQKRLLLLLDGLEKMTLEGFTEQVRSQLRGLAEGKDAPLQLVVAASEPLDQLFSGSRSMTSPVEGLCIEETILPWNEATVRAFITDRLQPTSVRFSEAEISKIVKDSEGNPRQVTVRCFQRYRIYQGALR